MNKKNNRRALFCSVISLLLCVSMLLGTTLAWFTDSVSSTGNIIKTGKLDVTMEYTGDLTGAWEDASDAAIFAGNLWEPGYSDMKFIRISNVGNLAFQYQLHILPAVKAADGAVDLADVIDVYIGEVDGSFAVPTAFATDMAGMSKLGTLAELMEKEPATSVLLPAGTQSTTEDVGSVTYCIVLHMQEDAGNEYQNLNVGNNFTVQLVATQMSYEQDAFGSSYDADAEWPYTGINFTIYMPIEGKIDPETNCLTEAVMIGEITDAQYALIPAGVKVAEGVDALTLKVTSMERTTANVYAGSRDVILRSVDIHVEGVAEDNTVPMTFGLEELFPTGLNNNNVKLFHVEDGETKEMTVVDTPVNHNEFSYDPLTGNAVLTIASFSEVATYADTNAPWGGNTFDYSWYNADGDLTIANATQFAAFRNIVDGVTVDGTYIQDDFEGQKITLNADINLNGHNFDPIGWGYENAAWNKDGADGKVFKGTFDGDGHTIYGLYQDGWDLGYSYTNCGFGLFAAACDATFENLTINGANIRVECVETGVLVGLAQGNCTFTNINILGCKAANYQRPVGGVVGEVSPKVENGAAVASVHTFNAVYVDSNTVVGSLWGDFDAPVGGVIGAYWDDAGVTSVSMNNVTVACELDVYNDVTSTYQWYAYRRAGMLIGNSDRVAADDAHKAAATYLTCSNVTVYYDAWADYHYCEFNKANPNWPWVRVEPGENCSGYSNPRWGRPIDSTTGQPVTDSVHEHGDNEGHLQSIPFHQLYGGGQGVYGAESHPGVGEGIYTVTYMDSDRVVRVDNVMNNSSAYTAPNINTVITGAADGTRPAYWVDAKGDVFTGCGAGRTADIIVYAKWPSEYAVRCLDTYGEVVYYNFVTDTDTSNYEAIATAISNTLVEIQNEVDKDKKVMIIVWKKADGSTTDNVTANDIKNSVEAGNDFILEATPKLQTTSITLQPVYDDTTGELIAYRVAEVTKDNTNTKVIIPDYVGKIPVTIISANAAAGFDNLHVMVIPRTMKNIGENALAADWENGMFGSDKGESLVVYYEGSYEEWCANVTLATGWSDGISASSRVFFLNGTQTVDPQQGYLQFVVDDDNWLGAVKAGHFDYVETVPNSMRSEYYKDCDCNVDGCKGNLRPDAGYWEAFAG